MLCELPVSANHLQRGELWTLVIHLPGSHASSRFLALLNFSIRELTTLPRIFPGPRESGLTEVFAAFYIRYESILLQIQNVLLVCPWHKTFPPTSLEFSQNDCWQVSQIFSIPFAMTRPRYVYFTTMSLVTIQHLERFPLVLLSRQVATGVLPVNINQWLNKSLPAMIILQSVRET